MENLENFDFRRILTEKNNHISATLNENGIAEIVFENNLMQGSITLDQQELLEVAFSLLCLVQTPVDTDVAYDLAETNLDDSDEAIAYTAKILKNLRKNLLDI